MSDYIKTQSGLLVPLERVSFAEGAPPADASSQGKPVTEEIASIQRDIHQLIFGGVLENLDDTLKTRARGKGLKIYEELERDTHAFSVLHKRKMAVQSRPWQVDAASESAQDKAIADLVARQLKALKFDRLTYNLLDATNKGFAVGEVMWEVRGNEIWAARVKPRNQRRFVFSDEEKPRLITRESSYQGEALPERKFIVHSVGNDETPYGLGLGHKLFWPVFFKRQDITFWLTFADKFGMPTALGKYPRGTDAAGQRTLLSALGAIAQDTGVIIPDGMVIELLEAARTGSTDAYEKLARYMDEQMSECVLGETMTTSAQGAGLGSNQASVHNDVRIELAQSDADLLSDTLNDSLVKWIVDFNFPGVTEYPTVWREFDEPEDLQKRSEVDKTLHDMGYEPESIEYINETYGGKWVKKAPPANPLGQPGFPGAGSAGPNPADFAEALDALAGQAAVDRAAGIVPDATLQTDIEPVLMPLLELVKAGADYPTLMARFVEAFPQMNTQRIEELVARAIFVSDLWGRITADAGTSASSDASVT